MIECYKRICHKRIKDVAIMVVTYVMFNAMNCMNKNMRSSIGHYKQVHRDQFHPCSSTPTFSFSIATSNRYKVAKGYANSSLLISICC